MAYRCVAASVAGFVQQLAVAYVTHGYWFYVTGRVPDHKDLASVDRKIIRQYGIEASKWTRTRRKKAGLANMQYLRYGRFFVILATHGEHPFFEAEGNQIHDIRKRPLPFMGYSIGCRRARHGPKWHASVRIHRTIYRELKARFEALAVHCSIEDLTRELRSIPYEPYAPIRDQLRGALRAINRRRKAAGMEPVPSAAIWRRRAPVRPFEVTLLRNEAMRSNSSEPITGRRMGG